MNTNRVMVSESDDRAENRQQTLMNTNRVMVSESDNRAENRQQTKTEDAFQAVFDRLESLGNATMNLQDRLVLVSNNYPRPPDELPKQAKDEGPNGDSELVSRLYEISEKISRQIGRINVVLERLDI